MILFYIFYVNFKFINKESFEVYVRFVYGDIRFASLIY